MRVRAGLTRDLGTSPNIGETSMGRSVLDALHERVDPSSALDDTPLSSADSIGGQIGSHGRSRMRGREFGALSSLEAEGDLEGVWVTGHGSSKVEPDVLVMVWRLVASFTGGPLKERKIKKGALPPIPVTLHARIQVDADLVLIRTIVDSERKKGTSDTLADDFVASDVHVFKTPAENENQKTGAGAEAIFTVRLREGTAERAEESQEERAFNLIDEFAKGITSAAVDLGIEELYFEVEDLDGLRAIALQKATDDAFTRATTIARSMNVGLSRVPDFVAVRVHGGRRAHSAAGTAMAESRPLLDVNERQINIPSIRFVRVEAEVSVHFDLLGRLSSGVPEGSEAGFESTTVGTGSFTGSTATMTPGEGGLTTVVIPPRGKSSGGTSTTVGSGSTTVGSGFIPSLTNIGSGGTVIIRGPSIGPRRPTAASSLLDPPPLQIATRAFPRNHVNLAERDLKTVGVNSAGGHAGAPIDVPRFIEGSESQDRFDERGVEVVVNFPKFVGSVTSTQRAQAEMRFDPEPRKKETSPRAVTLSFQERKRFGISVPEDLEKLQLTSVLWHPRDVKFKDFDDKKKALLWAREKTTIASTIYVLEREGTMTRGNLNPQTGKFENPVTLIDLTERIGDMKVLRVSHTGKQMDERGLLNGALDPLFNRGEAHQWVYIYYTRLPSLTKPEARNNRRINHECVLSRFKLPRAIDMPARRLSLKKKAKRSAKTAQQMLDDVMSSEQIILEVPFEFSNHNGGGMVILLQTFGMRLPNQKVLFIGIGDGGGSDNVGVDTFVEPEAARGESSAPQSATTSMSTSTTTASSGDGSGALTIGDSTTTSSSGSGFSDPDGIISLGSAQMFVPAVEDTPVPPAFQGKILRIPLEGMEERTDSNRPGEKFVFIRQPKELETAFAPTEPLVFAYGFRQPHHISATRIARITLGGGIESFVEILVFDVGQGERAVERIVWLNGEGNYGWSAYEGSVPLANLSGARMVGDALRDPNAKHARELISSVKRTQDMDRVIFQRNEPGTRLEDVKQRVVPRPVPLAPPKKGEIEIALPEIEFMVLEGLPLAQWARPPDVRFSAIVGGARMFNRDENPTANGLIVCADVNGDIHAVAESGVEGQRNLIYNLTPRSDKRHPDASRQGGRDIISRLVRDLDGNPWIIYGTRIVRLFAPLADVSKRGTNLGSITSKSSFNHPWKSASDVSVENSIFAPEGAGASSAYGVLQSFHDGAHASVGLGASMPTSKLGYALGRF